MKRLEGRVAIVTGGGRGIGKAFCLRLAEEGVKVVVADIIDTAGTVKEIEDKGGAAIGLNVDVSSEEDTKRMAAETLAKFGRIDILVNNAAVFYGLKDISLEDITVKEIEDKGGAAIGLHVDVSSEEETKRMAAETLAKFGRIDILVNNAAVFYGLKDISLEDITVEMWDKQMAVQPKGSWLCAKAVVPQMKKQGKGKIINIASDTVFIGRPPMMQYITSKGAVISMTYVMAEELGKYNICVNSVAPGSTLSEAILLRRPAEEAEKLASTRQCIKRAIYPEDITGTVVFLASDDADMITGQTIAVDGGMAKH